MARFICPKCDHKQNGHNVGIKVIDGKVRHDIQCEECGENMTPEKTGVGSPSFKSTRYGQVL